jgi:hypothetical protein
MDVYMNWISDIVGKLEMQLVATEIFHISTILSYVDLGKIQHRD